MMATERHSKWLAARLAKAAEQARVVAPAPANELVLKVDHVSGYTFRDALSRAIEAESAGGM